MKILVLGGTGAMGVPVVKILAERGNEVYVTSRKRKTSESKRIKYIQGDAHDIKFVKKIVSQHFDAVIDFMVYSSDNFSQYCDLYLAHTKQYIFLSSSRVYANSNGEKITENSPRLLDTINDPEYLKTDEYALAKAREENILKSSGYSNYTIIRPYITYYNNRLQLGVYEKENWLQRFLNGKKIVFSKNIASKLTTLTYGYDVSLRIADLVGNKNSLGQCYHITTEETVRWHDVLNFYLDTLEEYFGKRPEVFMIDQSDSHYEKFAKYQIHYDREYDRIFSNAKIQKDTLEKSDFIKVKNGLRNCLLQFLEGERVFTYRSWRIEGVFDKITGEKTSLFKISGLKNKLKYFIFRYIL